MRASRKVVSRVVAVGVLALGSTACEWEGLEPEVGVNFAQTASSSVHVARVMEPSRLGMANPASLAFSPRSGMLLVGGRAPGAAAGSATDIGLIALSEDRVGTVRIAAGVSDPVNMAFDGKANRLLILQFPNDHLIEIAAAADGSLDPQSLERIDARGFGLQGPQGLVVDPVSGHLFVLDYPGPRIVRVEPHPQRGFANPTVADIDLTPTGSSNLRGLAFDPTSGRMHVLDPVARVLYELTQTGQVMAARDMGAIDLRNPQGMTFGPSGDSTDDPDRMNLYIADSGTGGGAMPSAGIEAMTVVGGTVAESGQIAELSLVEPTAAPEALESASLIQSIDTWRFSPPSPDPAGITFLPHVGELLISDSEVNEMGIFTGVNQFQISLSGNLSRTSSTTSFSGEPTGVTWNPGNGHLFYTDDNARDVFEVDPGPDGLYNTSDDGVTSFDTGGFGSGDPEGVTFDSSQGVLFIADGVDSEVYRVSPGGNGVFDGNDDVVTSFDTSGDGLTDPEGIAYDSDLGHLYVVGRPKTLVFKFTTEGTLLGTIDISAANASKPAGLAYAPSSVNQGEMSLWIVDRNVDNDSNSSENDGEAYEFSLPSSSGNALPTVTIVAPQGGSTFTEGTSIAFTGSASDAEDGNLTASLAWTSSLDGGIGSGGSFSTATLSLGSHTITASVTDSGGRQGSDQITVTVNPEGAFVLDVRVATSTDDAEEAASGGVSLTSSDLELVLSGSDQTVGMRFNAITIPPGATINNASIQFQVDEATSVATSLSLRGEAVDNAAAFSSAGGNISARSMTASSVVWSPAPWATVGQAGPDQRSPNIASIIQEIVNRPGWSSGNSLVIRITGTGKRTAESYDGAPNGAPLLHVDYTMGSGGNSAPTASNVAITGAAVVDEQLDGSYTYTDTDGDTEGSSTYRWLRDGSPISGATGQSYTLAPADQGALIIFEVTPVAATGASPGAPIQSAAVGPVAADAGGPFVLDVRVASGSDDAEERGSGHMSLNSSDLELTFDRSNSQSVGMRFNTVAIPPGATINNATIQFQVDEAASGATSLTIRGEAADNATAFTNTSGNISSRITTASSTSWSPAPWTSVGQAGPDQRTPNIASIIQEIVNRPGWSSGNSVVIVITGTGTRTAESYNGVPTAAPLLHVDYSLGSGGNVMPVASGVAISGSPMVGGQLSGIYTYSDPDGDAEGSSAYRWLRDGSPVSGAAGQTYMLTPADQGALMVFEVTPVSVAGTSPGVPAQSGPAGPVTVDAGGPFVVEVRVAAGTDDAEESASGSVSLTSSDLELVLDRGSDQTVGMRFNAVGIPAGATISSASVQFQVDEANSVATSLTIKGEAADNAATFSSSTGNISSRSVTASSVPWSPAPWTAVGQAGPDQQTPDIASIIQEIVNRPGWSSGSSLVIIITGTGERTSESYNGVPGAAPLLQVVYTVE